MIVDTVVTMVEAYITYIHLFLAVMAIVVFVMLIALIRMVAGVRKPRFNFHGFQEVLDNPLTHKVKEPKPSGEKRVDGFPDLEIEVKGEKYYLQPTGEVSALESVLLMKLTILLGFKQGIKENILTRYLYDNNLWKHFSKVK